VVLLSGLGGIFSTPSYAANVQFYCNTSGSLPTTIARNSVTGASREVIRWYSEYFSGSGYDPMSRCQEVSGRFQRAYNDGSLNYVTAGIVNGMPVVCAASPGGSCNPGNLLFTLKRGVNAAATLQRLFDVRDLGGAALYESEGATYINVKYMITSLDSSTGSNAPVAIPSESNQPSVAPTNPGRAF
jgi:hypothetical protein